MEVGIIMGWSIEERPDIIWDILTNPPKIAGPWIRTDHGKDESGVDNISWHRPTHDGKVAFYINSISEYERKRSRIQRNNICCEFMLDDGSIEYFSSFKEAKSFVDTYMHESDGWLYYDGEL
jgi:hypothetical protein